MIKHNNIVKYNIILMDYNISIPDIYKTNNKIDNNITIEDFIIKPNTSCEINNNDCLFMYIETNSKNLYGKFGYPIYDKMFKIFSMPTNLDYIKNISDFDSAHVRIYKYKMKISQKLLFSFNYFEIINFYTNEFIKHNALLFISNSIDCICNKKIKKYEILENMMIKTSEELKKNKIYIESKNMIFCYISIKINKNCYKLKIYKIINKINNKILNINTNITINNFLEHYNKLCYELENLNICESYYYFQYINLDELAKLYHIYEFNNNHFYFYNHVC
jgi:hypothetical protein